MRKARRFCPGVEGEICSICCGTERENTVRCPFECVYLEEARLHERPADLPANAEIPNKDIVVRERFLEQHGEQVNAVGSILVRAALREPGTVDNDVRDVLEALIRTWRTLQSGLYYDSRPENAVAARVFDNFRAGMEEYRQKLHKESMAFVSDSDVLTILAFLQRVELDRNNGRRLGRAFIDFLRRHLGAPEETAQTASPLIHPA